MKKVMPKIIEGRLKELLALIKEATQINLIEREVALLAMDITLTLKRDGKLLEYGCNCFQKIDLAISGTLRKKLSNETRDLLNEMIILDELGKNYGPDLALIIQLTKKILDKQNTKFIKDVQKLAEAGIGNRI